jgi:uncharacterized protein
MKLDIDRTGGNLIRSFAEGHIHIGATTYDSPVIVSTDRIIADWTPPAVEELSLDHFAQILALEPEVILLGTGVRQRFPRQALIADILGRGVGFEVMATGAACRTYNVLASEFRRVVAALIPA